MSIAIFDNPPTGQPDSVSTPIGTPVDGNVLDNDSDPNPGDELTVESVNGQPISTPVTTAEGGMVVMNPDGSFSYTPPTGFQGTDSFTYEACDEGGNCFTETATIEIRNATVGVAKNSAWHRDSDELTLTFSFEHLGNVPALNLSLLEDLDAVLGTGAYVINSSQLTSGPDTISIHEDYDGSANTELIAAGSSLLPGQTATITVEVQITRIEDPQDNGLGFYTNQVTLNSEDSTGFVYRDLSVDGTNVDPDGDGDPLNNDGSSNGDLNPDATVGIAKNVSANADNLSVTMDFIIEHFGNTRATEISLIDNLDAVFGAGQYLSLIHI